MTNESSRPTISVQGRSQVRQRPSHLILLGRIQAAAPTLELALQNLNRKREAISRWLGELGAEDIRFGEARFPDQVVPDPMRMAHKMTQLRMRGRPEPSQNVNGKSSVLVSYSAQWPIIDRSSDEVLVFVDRIQFEAADLQGAEERPAERPHSWEADPLQNVQALLSDVVVPPPDGDEIHFLFLSRLTASQREEALAAAFHDGQEKASMMARAAGKELHELRSAHWTSSESEALSNIDDHHRRNSLPLLSEVPFRTGPNQSVHENLRAAEFSITVHLTFEMK